MILAPSRGTGPAVSTCGMPWNQAPRSPRAASCDSQARLAGVVCMAVRNRPRSSRVTSAASIGSPTALTLRSRTTASPGSRSIRISQNSTGGRGAPATSNQVCQIDRTGCRGEFDRRRLWSDRRDLSGLPRHRVADPHRRDDATPHFRRGAPGRGLHPPVARRPCRARHRGGGVRRARQRSASAPGVDPFGAEWTLVPPRRGARLPPPTDDACTAVD